MSEELSPEETKTGQPVESATDMVQETSERTPAEIIAELEKERDAFKDQLYRKAADFENFRRQKEKEAAAYLKFAEKGLIKALLPNIDDLERVIKNADKFLEGNPDAKIYVDGVRLAHQKLLKTLEQRGVKKIEALGKKFDVNFHEALTQMPKSDVEPETVVDEFEAGYIMHDEVIRHSKVVISKEAE